MILERLKKLGARERILLVLAVLIVFVLLADRFAVRPVLRGYERLDAALDLEENNIKYAQGVLAKRDTVRREYETLSGSIESAGSKVQAIDAMKDQIEKLAEETGVVLISREHREPSRSELVEEYTVEIGKFEAAMPALLRFLHQLPHTPGTPRVAELTLSPDRSTGLVKGAMLITKVMLPAQAGSEAR